MKKCNFISRSLGANEYEIILFPPVMMHPKSMRALMHCSGNVDPAMIEDAKFQFGYATLKHIFELKRMTSMQLACCNSPAHAISYIEGNADALWYDSSDLSRYFSQEQNLIAV